MKVIDSTGPSLSGPANSFCSASLQLKRCCSSVSLWEREHIGIRHIRVLDDYNQQGLRWIRMKPRVQGSIFQWKLCSFHLHPGGICCSSDLLVIPLNFFHTLNNQLHSCYPCGENEKVAVEMRNLTLQTILWFPSWLYSEMTRYKPGTQQELWKHCESTF